QRRRGGEARRRRSREDVPRPGRRPGHLLAALQRPHRGARHRRLAARQTDHLHRRGRLRLHRHRHPARDARVRPEPPHAHPHLPPHRRRPALVPPEGEPTRQTPVPAQEFDASIAGKLTALRLELAMMAREVREQLGLTRAEAAKQGNISVEDLERIETTSVGSVPLEATYEYLYRLGVELHLVASD